MTLHSRNKVANKSTGGSIKAGLVPSVGKHRLSRDKSLTKGVVNLTKDNIMFTPPPVRSNVKFFNYNDLIKPKNITIQELIDKSIHIFNKEYPYKFFSTFIITSKYNSSSIFLYNKPNSPYTLFSCTFTKHNNSTEFVTIKLNPGNTIKIDFSNSDFLNVSDFLSVTLESFVKTRMPYSQINCLPIEQQKSIQQSSNLLTGFSPINVWYNDIIDQHNILCNFLPTEGAGIYKYSLNISTHHYLPDEYKLTILTHKILQ